MWLLAEELKTRGVAWTLRILQRATPTIVMALLASLLNIVCAYDPIGYGVPYVPGVGTSGLGGLAAPDPTARAEDACAPDTTT